MAQPWFRFYGGEFLNDEKIWSLDGNERSVWITLLCLASQKGGVVSFVSEQSLIQRSGIKNWKRYEGVLSKFAQRGMVTLDNGNVTVCNWAKRQYSPEYARVLKHRQKNDTEMIRKGNANDTPYTDTDTESDTENTNTSFEKFWSIFPKKVARKKAEQSWRKIPPSEHPAIYADVSRRRASEDWTKQNGQFIPHPATYLNQERWKDQVEVPKTPPERKCKECRTEKSTSWIQASGGWLCGECQEGLGGRKPNKKLSEMKGRTLGGRM